ncbi:MAG: hypothetical protein GW938_08095 [Leptospira sp.]|nr:hypothetical protein [Leptospira sp.]NCS94739.1 hypothetical protein [Leptospira sp.]
MEQLKKFELITQENEILKAGLDFDHVLQRVGKEPFGKQDLEFYFRQLGEIEDRIKNSRSAIKTYIQSIGQFTKKETKQAIGNEAREILDKDILEIILLLKELTNGKEAEFSLLEKGFRKRVNK